MRTYLVTGGAGFIGGNFVHYYLKEHPEVRDEIEGKIRALLAGKEVAEDAQAADSADEDEEEFLGIDI